MRNASTWFGWAVVARRLCALFALLLCVLAANTTIAQQPFIKGKAYNLGEVIGCLNLDAVKRYAGWDAVRNWQDQIVYPDGCGTINIDYFIPLQFAPFWTAPRGRPFGIRFMEGSARRNSDNALVTLFIVVPDSVELADPHGTKQ
jgi:hypothetical protein